jgi:hypothetical protein
VRRGYGGKAAASQSDQGAGASGGGPGGIGTTTEELHEGEGSGVLAPSSEASGPADGYGGNRPDPGPGARLTSRPGEASRAHRVLLIVPSPVHGAADGEQERPEGDGPAGEDHNEVNQVLEELGVEARPDTDEERAGGADRQRQDRPGPPGRRQRGDTQRDEARVRRVQGR